MYCRPVISKSPPFKGLNIRTPIIIPIKEGGFVNKGSRFGGIWGSSLNPKS